MSFALNRGQTQQMAVAFTDQFGASLHGIGVPVWSSSDPSVASVNAVGLVTALAAGTATITAVLDTVSGSSVVTVAAPIVVDAFNRADNASSLGTADIGGAWTALSGTFGISSNQATLVTHVGDDLAVVTTTAADVTVKATFVSGANPYLVLRASDASNFIRALFSAGSWFIQKRIATVFTTVASVAGTLANNDVITFVGSGSNLSIAQNGTVILAGSDAFNASAVLHGFGAANAGALFDNFQITAP